MSITILEYGSRARSRHDEFSDSDVLVAYDSAVETDRIELRKNPGMAVYTKNRLLQLSQDGSLFVKHLILEAKVIMDDDNFLGQLRSRYNHRSSYNREFESAKRIYELLTFMPNTNSATGWGLDVLFVSFRAMAIPYLANHMIFKFDYGEILTELIRKNILSRDESDQLHLLRIHKTRYRRGLSISCDRTVFDSICRTVGRCFSIQLHPRDSYGYSTLLTELKNTEQVDWYRSLRLAELITILNSGALSSESLFWLRKMINDPRGYSGQIRFHKHRLIAMLEEHFLTG